MLHLFFSPESNLNILHRFSSFSSFSSTSNILIISPAFLHYNLLFFFVFSSSRNSLSHIFHRFYRNFNVHLSIFFYNSPIFLFRHSSTRFFFFFVFILFVAIINLQHLNILNVFHRSSRRNFHVYLSIISAMFLSSTTPQYLFFTICPTSSFFLLQMSSLIIPFYLCKVLFKFKFK